MQRFSVRFVLAVAAPFALCLPIAQAQGGDVRYVVDPPASAVDARVAFFGIASKTAHFPDMNGSFKLSLADIEALNMVVDIDARTLTTGDAQTNMLRGRQFFDVAHYPTVHFVGQRMHLTGEKTATVDGLITARGVTRPLRMDVTFSVPPLTTGGTEPIAITGRTTIDRSAFGMTAFPLIVGRMVAVTIHARMLPL